MKVGRLPESGEADGYKASFYEVNGGNWRIAMNPVPGVTGMETALARGAADGLLSIEWVPTPGAAEGRAAMFADVCRTGVTEIKELVIQEEVDKERELLEKQIADAAAVDVIFGPQGHVKMPGETLSEKLSEKFVRAMQFGVYGEKWPELPSLQRSDVDGKAPGSVEPVGFGVLRSLTASYVANATAKRALLELVGQAEAASQRRDVAGMRAALRNNEQRVESLAGQRVPLISPIGAETLVQ